MYLTLLFGGVGPEILVIILVVIILAVTDKIGPAAEAAGETLSNFKGGIQKGKDNFEENFQQNTEELSDELLQLDVVDETIANQFVSNDITTLDDLKGTSADELQQNFDLTKSEAIEIATKVE